MASATGTELTVNVAYPAPSCCKDTPKVAAVGITCPIVCPSWSIVTLPKFCVWINVSFTLDISLAFKP